MSILNKYKEKGFADINYDKVKKYRVRSSDEKKNYILILLTTYIFFILVVPLTIQNKLVISLFVLLAMYFLKTKVLDKKEKMQHWDGVIYSKNIDTHVSYEEDGYVKDQVYIIEVKKENGKILKYEFNNRKDLYDYYKIGEIVRHHKGFDLFEKFDKTKSEYILCLACLKLNAKKRNECKKCGCELFK
jgi:hypothetical protein